MNRMCAVLMMFILMLLSCTTIGLCDHKDIEYDLAPLNHDCGCSPYSFSNSGLNEAYMVMQHPILVDASISYYNSSQIQTGALPTSYNWKNIEGVDWTTPAKHQKNCGSCWDFAALGSLEAP